MIERTFSNIVEGKAEEFGYRPHGLVHSAGIDWDTLLKSKRILIVSEAGSGKTYECTKNVKYFIRLESQHFSSS